MPNTLRIALRTSRASVELDFDGEATLVETALPRLLERLLLALTETGNSASPSVGTPLSGVARDYFTGAILVGARVEAAGSVVLPEAVTDSEGRFTLEAPRPDEVHVRVDGGQGLQATLNGPLRLAAAAGVEVHGVARADIVRQYTTVGVAPSSAAGTLLVEIQGADGGPLEGIPAADISLVDAGSPAGVGPFFFGASGDVEPAANLPVSTAAGGRTRLAFLNVPPGELRLRVAGGPGRDVAIVISTLSDTTTLAVGRATGV